MARKDRKEPTRPRPVSEAGTDGLMSGAAYPMNEHNRVTATIQLYFLKVWMMAKPNTDATYEMTTMITQPTEMIIA